MEHTADTRREIWRTGCSAGDRPTDRDLHRERHAGDGRHRRGARDRTACAGRPLGHRLRRHRGGRLRRPDDDPPTAVRVRPSRSRGAPGRDRHPIRGATGHSIWRPSWWSARPRRLRRRAVDEGPREGSAPARDTRSRRSVHGQHPIQRAKATSPDGALRRHRLRKHPCRGLRRARGRVHASAAASAAPSAAAPSAQPRRPATRPVRERRSRRAELRHRSGRAERLLRDRLRPAVQALGGVHQAVPERDLEDQPGPVHQPDDRDPAAPVGRQSSGPDPAAVDGRPGQGRTAQEPRRLRDRLRLGQVAGRAARAEPGRDRRHARLRVRSTRWASTTA